MFKISPRKPSSIVRDVFNRMERLDFNDHVSCLVARCPEFKLTGDVCLALKVEIRDYSVVALGNKPMPFAFIYRRG